MKVVEETITTLCDIEGPGLTVFMGGYRIALTQEEARALVSSVGAALSGAADGSGEATSIASDDDTTEGAAIAAKVRDRVISWARITEAVQRK